ncbi:MAG: serine/threonine protein kinase [Phycisphaerales bacterium]|nr:serine/threonine protein kinase [Phycisphaerales bacterium]
MSGRRDVDDDAFASRLIGRRVGAYVVKSVIATGGMGTVYLAEQEHPRREVALKVLKAGIAGGGALRRFEFESAILARLRHPNIAQVYDAGMHVDAASGRSPTPEWGGAPGAPGLPWFAMEFIPDARTITAYAREGGLSIVERVKLFADVCDAVHHGHQKGVIHRDLKPVNILVDAEGRPKVIDFGVARGTDSDVAVTTMHTDAGQIIGTLAYMSPEQCAADPRNIDTRSDVYALGVVLYELVCDRPPYDVRHATIHAAARIICEQEPERPREHDRRVPRDLETVLLKALEKDREKRYASAAEFRADLLRFIRGEPVEARPPTLATRAVRWAIRHPALVTASVCFFVGAAVLGGTALATWWYNFRPHRFEVLNKDREARLVSVGGKLIKAWNSPEGGKTCITQIVRHRSTASERRLVVIGFTSAQDASTPMNPNSLCAFDADGDLDVPLWERHIEDGDVPEHLLRHRGFEGREFGVYAGLIADVFSGAGGNDEIVAVYQHSTTTNSVLRIYDLNGTTLYQVWIDVNVAALYWMGDAGLLIVGGLNGSAYWPERGHPEVKFAHPTVLFAVRPRRGIIERAYLAEAPGDGPLAPVWYQCVLPPTASDKFGGLRFVAPGPKYESGRHVKVDWGVLPSLLPEYAPMGLGWIVNEFGEVVERNEPNDVYRLNQSKLPDPASIHFGPLPPIVVKREP